MRRNIIQTFNLTKVYELKGKNKKITALNDVNLSIKEGEIFGLLGPNGAGKTTFIQCLTSLVHPTKGYAIIDGHNIVKNPLEAKKRIALMLGKSMLYYRMTAYDNLKFFCKIYKVPHNKERIYNIAKEFGLEQWLDQYVEKFSGGMKTKLALCRTFLLNRPILFLDEPTLGLDVLLKQYMTDKIKTLNRTILFTSHDMSVVEKVCDRIAFINKGEIIRIGTKEDFKNVFQGQLKLKIKIEEDKTGIKSELKQQNFIIEISDINGGFDVSLKSRKYFSDLLLILGKYKVSYLKEYELTLEDFFFKLN